MPRTNDIADRIAAHETKLRALDVEHSDTSLLLEEDPHNDAVLGTLDAIEREQAAQRKTIARLQGAAAAEQRRNSVEAKLERLTMIKAARKRLTSNAAECIAVARDLEKAISALALPLARWQKAVEQRAADAHAIVAHTHEHGALAQRAAASISESSHLRHGAITEALADAIASTGLSTTGPDLRPYVTVVAPPPASISKPLPLVDAVTISNERLFAALDTHLARAAAELGVAP
jgi:hypothetical protein